jgi:hypothetical protein
VGRSNRKSKGFEDRRSKNARNADGKECSRDLLLEMFAAEIGGVELHEKRAQQLERA